ncbi:MAG: ACP S-malonyltransferase, partial [Anaerolineales bacterium]|nr:ACP S-malonyltransferase [Anaerolineales bacterium]
ASAAVSRPLVVANDNCPGQIVISGDSQALDYALPLAQAQGAKRTIKLAVSVAAHSPLMADAESEFKQVVARTPISKPNIPIIGNIHATLLDEVDAIQIELSGQLTSAVRWTETIQTMRTHGIKTFIEVGTKGVLKGLLKKIDRDAIGLSIEKPSDLLGILHD